MDPLILSLDLGTSSIRAALFTSAGTRVIESTSHEKSPLQTKSDGTCVMRPAALLKSVRECIHRTLQYARSDRRFRARPIAAVGVSCFWHSLLGVDDQGTPLTDVVTWADSRCRDDAAELRRVFSESVIHGRTGCMLRSSFWPSKLRWLRRTDPSGFKKVRRWMSPAEWIQLQIAGSAHCAIGMATGTGLFDPSTLAWDPELLSFLKLKASSFLEISDKPSAISSSAVRHFPELAGAVWFPAIGDGAASNLGSGCTKPGMAAINVGTSAALRVMRAGKVARAPFGLFCYRVDAARYLVGGAVSNAGNLRAWGISNLQTGSPAALEKAMSGRLRPAHGLTVLPFWTTERAPSWNENLNGVILGITQATSGIDLLQAITEGTYHRLALIAEMVTQKTGDIEKFLVSGGIQSSKSAMQRLANTMNITLHPNPEAEASIRGAAVFAVENLGLPITPLKCMRAIRPQRAAAVDYQKERERISNLERLLEQNPL